VSNTGAAASAASVTPPVVAEPGDPGAAQAEAAQTGDAQTGPAPARPEQAAEAGPPTIDVTRLRVAIARMSRSLRRHELAGLTPTQLSALSTVDKAGPLRLGDLAAAEKIAPSTLTRLVTVLEDRGYVRRGPVPGDARASMLAVTDEGHAILERMRQESNIMLAGSLRMLSPDQLEALTAALPALEKLADATPLHPGTR
jgi:DNA-binding MarR family transcriptional regulator